MQRLHTLFFSSLLFPGLLVGQAARISGDPSSKTASETGGMDLVPIADDVKVIEEASLIFKAVTLKSANAEALPGHQYAPGSQMSDMTQEAPTAFRCYGFVLAAGESLKLRLKGETGGKIFMKFLPKTPADAMISQVRRANGTPAPFRSSRIEISNITDGPYQVALLLYGQPNYPFRLEVERKKK